MTHHFVLVICILLDRHDESLSKGGVFGGQGHFSGSNSTSVRLGPMQIWRASYHAHHPHTQIGMHKLLGLTFFVHIAFPPATAYGDAYGSCLDYAQSYQDRYKASHRVQDLICIQ